MLLSGAKELLLIDTDTGEVRARFPMREPLLERLARLLHPAAPDSEVGSVWGAEFRGEQLWIQRQFEWSLRRMGRAASRRVWDVYELKNIAENAGPDYRVKAHPYWSCAPAEGGLPGLRDENGRLVYR